MTKTFPIIIVFLTLALTFSAWGDTGPRALPGRPGEKGSQVLQGTKGPPGEPGSSGAKGDPGEQGIQGSQGPQGPQGAQGIQGLPGDPGAKGDKGEQGDQGYVGPPGEQGAQGAPGIPGTPGAKGDKGDKGDTGDQGIQGTQGTQGPAGDVSTCWPVGSVFISVVTTDPATLLGFGTWAQIAQGQMLIGQKAADADFDVAEETGGAKTKTIAQANLPNISTGTGTSHNHTQDAHTHNFLPRSGTTGSVSSIVTGTLDTSSTISGANQPHVQNSTATNQAEATHTHPLGGSGTALDVMNPYFVIYVWKRTG